MNKLKIKLNNIVENFDARIQLGVIAVLVGLSSGVAALVLNFGFNYSSNIEIYY